MRQTAHIRPLTWLSTINVFSYILSLNFFYILISLYLVKKKKMKNQNKNYLTYIETDRCPNLQLLPIYSFLTVKKNYKIRKKKIKFDDF